MKIDQITTRAIITIWNLSTEWIQNGEPDDKTTHTHTHFYKADNIRFSQFYAKYLDLNRSQKYIYTFSVRKID